MTFDSSQSQRLKLIRAVAVVMILITHISQEYKINLGEYTNTGVQMFLVTSGFILGQSETIDWRKWIFNRLLRILPPYYVILLATAVAYRLFLKKNILNIHFLSHFSTFHFLFFPDYPFWGGHLWYITAIMLCYIIFPLLLLSKNINTIKFLTLYIILAPLILFALFYKTELPYRLSGDIYCFILGFVAANIFKEKLPAYLNVLLLFLSLAIFSLEYIYFKNGYWNISLLNSLIELSWPWKKCIYGATACILLYSPVFHRISFNSAINLIDRYSYELYLSHKNFILGPLSFLYITNNPSLNVILALASSLLCALIVYKIATFVKGIVEKHTKASPDNLLQWTLKGRGH